MNFKSVGDNRNYALYISFERIQDYILDNTDLCNKAFRIIESKIINPVDGTPEHRFEIREIPIEIQRLEIPYQQQIPRFPRKYNLKERIRILFKGE